jgi:hypothetical protein
LAVVLVVGGSWWAGHEARLREELARLNAPENSTMLAPIACARGCRQTDGCDPFLEFPGRSGVHWDFAIEVTWGSLICE